MELKHKSTQSIEELKKQRKSNLKDLIDKKQTVSGLNKLALWITNHVGSMGFFVIIFIWTACWLSWNIFAPVPMRFDPYPAFVLWLFISNMIQLFLLPLIMIGQNLQSSHADARAEADFEINKQAEREIETVLQHLENQNALILKILERVENNVQKKS